MIEGMTGREGGGLPNHGFQQVLRLQRSDRDKRDRRKRLENRQI